jgi:transcriptional regulator with XRE-family HTH domain
MPCGRNGRQAASFGGAASGGVTPPPLPEAGTSAPGQTGAMARQQRQDGGTELGHFLYARRTQVTPAEVGLIQGAGVRRTPGLRREEVAALAGVSIDYYTRLERGRETRPSPAVVDALARAPCSWTRTSTST